MNRKARAEQLKSEIPAVFLSLKSKDTPLAAKILAGITICYALSPIDLIPDFIPIVGYLDDIVIVPALVALTIRLIPPPVFERYKKDAESLWKDGEKKRWYYAIPIAALWLLAIWLLTKAL